MSLPGLERRMDGKYEESTVRSAHAMETRYSSAPSDPHKPQLTIPIGKSYRDGKF